jgi:hypothetical protein
LPKTLTACSSSSFGPLDPRDSQERAPGDRRDLVEVELANRSLDLVVCQVGDRLARGDHAEPRIVLGQLEQQDLETWVLELAAFESLAGLQRFQAVKQEERAPPLDQLGEAVSAVPGGEPRAGGLVAEAFKRLGDELVARGHALAGALAVERPGEDPLGAAVVVLVHGLAPAAHQGGFADAARRLEDDHVQLLIVPCLVEEVQLLPPTEQQVFALGQARDVDLGRRTDRGRSLVTLACFQVFYHLAGHFGEHLIRIMGKVS